MRAVRPHHGAKSFRKAKAKKSEDNSMKRILCGLTAFAGLMGACGVAAAAAAAHMPGGARLSSVALVLLVHAAAVLNLATRAGDPQVVGDSRADPRFWLAAGLALAFGAALFSSDVTLLTLRGARLFPMAAPTGGMTMIFGWMLVGLAAIVDFFRSYR